MRMRIRLSCYRCGIVPFPLCLASSPYPASAVRPSSVSHPPCLAASPSFLSPSPLCPMSARGAPHIFRNICAGLPASYWWEGGTALAACACDGVPRPTYVCIGEAHTKTRVPGVTTRLTASWRAARSPGTSGGLSCRSVRSHVQQMSGREHVVGVNRVSVVSKLD